MRILKTEGSYCIAKYNTKEKEMVERFDDGEMYRINSDIVVPREINMTSADVKNGKILMDSYPLTILRFVILRTFLNTKDVSVPVETEIDIFNEGSI